MITLKNNEQLNKLDKNKPIVLALSGGVDSMVLFSLLKKENFKIIIAHVNHHKRKESMIEEEYIKKMQNDSTIVEVLDYYYEKDNFQADAHHKRYDFFYSLAKKYNASAIITAHHAQDNLETIIINMVKGSNMFGYSGISLETNYKDVLVLRPLLNYTKEEIYDYAKANNIKYFEDSSNQEDDYLRNRIRHHVIPLLLKENPSLYKSIKNYSEQISSAFSYIRMQSIHYFNENNGKIILNSFNNLALIQKKDIINYMFEKNNILSKADKISDILELINNSKPNLKYHLGNNCYFIKAYEECFIEEIKEKEFFYETLNLEDNIFIPNYGNFFFKDTINSNNKNWIKLSLNEMFPLTIRNRKNGDKITTGLGHKKLKDFFIDKKIPKDERDKIIIIANEKDEILWVLGYYKKPCNDNNFIYLCFEEIKNDK